MELNERLLYKHGYTRAQIVSVNGVNGYESYDIGVVFEAGC